MVFDEPRPERFDALHPVEVFLAAHKPSCRRPHSTGSWDHLEQVRAVHLRPLERLERRPPRPGSCKQAKTSKLITSKALVTRSDALVTSSFLLLPVRHLLLLASLFLVEMHFAPNSVLAPSSDGRQPTSDGLLPPRPPHPPALISLLALLPSSTCTAVFLPLLREFVHLYKKNLSLGYHFRYL